MPTVATAPRRALRARSPTRPGAACAGPTSSSGAPGSGAELDNLRSAVAWSLDSTSPTTTSSPWRSSPRSRRSRARPRARHRRWAARAIDRAERARPAGAYAVLAAAAYYAAVSGDFDRGREPSPRPRSRRCARRRAPAGVRLDDARTSSRSTAATTCARSRSANEALVAILRPDGPDRQADAPRDRSRRTATLGGRPGSGTRARRTWPRVRASIRQPVAHRGSLSAYGMVMRTRSGRPR